MAFDEKRVRLVIEVLHDGERGFSTLSAELKTASAKTYFVEESQVRGQFASELEMTLSAANGEIVEEGGTATGTLHRTWGELKAKLGGTDHTLLATAEQGEVAAQKAYAEALKATDMPDSLREVLQRQQTHIDAAHNKIVLLRDSIAA